MRVTQWGEYATHFCIYLTMQERKGQRSVTAAEFAKMRSIDPLYAQQILQRLRKNKLIESIRGAQGGYKLSRKPEDITLKDILAAAEGDTFEMICDTKPINGKKCAPQVFCSVRTIWSDLKEHIDSFLASKTLADLVRDHNYKGNLVSTIGRAH